jgi:hypothetical protein
MQIIDTGHGPGITLNKGEVLTRDLILEALEQHNQFLPASSRHHLAAMFAALERYSGHSGQDLTEVQA